MADQTSSKTPTPRGKKPGDRRLTPRTGPSAAMWYALGFLLLLALANAFVFSFQSGQTVSYSDFKTLVREGKVQEVTVARGSHPRRAQAGWRKGPQLHGRHGAGPEADRGAR